MSRLDLNIHAHTHTQNVHLPVKSAVKRGNVRSEATRRRCWASTVRRQFVSAPSARGWRSGRGFSSEDDFVPAANAVEEMTAVQLWHFLTLNRQPLLLEPSVFGFDKEPNALY